MVEIRVTLLRNQLIEAVEKQLKAHQEEFQKARDGWRQQMLTLGQELIDKGLKLKRFPVKLMTLCAPAEHSREIKEVLDMLVLSQDESFSLEHDDYNQLVLGRWHWRDEWVSSNASYLSGSTGPTGPTGSCGGSSPVRVADVKQSSSFIAEDDME